MSFSDRFIMNRLEEHQKGDADVIEVPGAKEVELSSSPRDTIPALANGLIVVYDKDVNESDKNKVRKKAGALVNSVYTGSPIEHLVFPRAKEPNALQKVKAALEADNRVISVDYDRVTDIVLPNLRQQRERERQQRERARLQREREQARRQNPPRPPNKPQQKPKPPRNPPRNPSQSPPPPNKPNVPPPQNLPAEVTQKRDLMAMNVPAAWALSNGAGVRVALLDSGFDHSHLEINSQFVGEFDFLTNDNFAEDKQGHGTATSSLVGALVGNDRGIAGVAPGSRMLMAKIFSAPAFASTSSLLNALNWSASNGAKVISVSANWGGADSSLISWSNSHYQQISLFGSTGNTGRRDLSGHYPANFNGWQGVGGTDVDGKAWWNGATWGPIVDISAPAINVLVAYANNNDHYLYGQAYGTSMSCPLVAGVAALIRSRHPNFNSDKVWDSIRTTARNPQTPGGYNEKLGWGIPNAHAAVAKP